jgi:hypothetical protein
VQVCELCGEATSRGLCLYDTPPTKKALDDSDVKQPSRYESDSIIWEFMGMNWEHCSRHQAEGLVFDNFHQGSLCFTSSYIVLVKYRNLAKAASNPINNMTSKFFVKSFF